MPQVTVPGEGMRTKTLRSTFLGAMAFALLVTTGCSTEPTTRLSVTPGSRGWSHGPEGEDDPVVAKVRGVPIHLSEVRRQLELAGDGADPEAIMDRIIDFEVLAQEASARGLERHSEVEDQATRAMVQVMLMHEFEPRTTPDHIPEEILRRAYEKNWAMFNNPPLVEVCHMVLMVSPRATEQVWEERHREIMEIYRALQADPPASKDDFMAMANVFADRYDQLRAEDLHYIAQKGRMVREFSDAAFQIPGDGRFSEPVRTVYGWHIIYRYGSKPEHHESFEQVVDTVREKVWPDWRRHEFRKLLDAAMAATPWESYPDRLDWPPSWLDRG